VHHDTLAINPDETRAICTRLLARNTDGSVRSYRAFCRQLRRQVVLHTPDPAAARAEALAERTAYGVIETDGTGTLTVTGEAGRVTAAIDRVDDLARRLRAAGDARTLSQLRSDVALDLVLYGWTASKEVPPAEQATFVGQPPPARVTLVVSLSTLLAVTDDTGTGPGVVGVAELWMTASGRSYVTQRHAYDDPLARPVSEAEIVEASALDPPPF